MPADYAQIARLEHDLLGLPAPRLVCGRCGEPMGTDINRPGDTHGATWWRGGECRQDDGLYHCGGVLAYAC